MSGSHLGLLTWGGVVQVHYVVCGVCVAHNVCVVLGSSLVFFVFFCYVMMGRKIVIFILSQHSGGLKQDTKETKGEQKD